MKQYLSFLTNILQHGNIRTDRTSTGTISVFGAHMSFNMADGFPLVTTKKVKFSDVVSELLWFISGSTSSRDLIKNNVNIWNQWAVAESDTKYSLEERIELLKASGFMWTTRDEAMYEKTKYTGSATDAKRYFESLFTNFSIPSHRNLEVGDLGPIYGHQWRSWAGVNAQGTKHTVDQLDELIKNLKTNPFSRRHIVSAWNVNDLPDESVSPQQNVVDGKMALAPCHVLFQFYAEYRNYDTLLNELTESKRIEFEQAFGERLQREQDAAEARAKSRGSDGIDVQSYFEMAYSTEMLEWFEKNGVKTKMLSLQLYQRSMDAVLGGPYNIASYALLLAMVSQVTDMVPGMFHHTIGDAHVYKNHIIAEPGRDTVFTQLARKPYALPKLKLNPEITSIFDFKKEDIVLEDYQSHSVLGFRVAV